MLLVGSSFYIAVVVKVGAAVGLFPLPGARYIRLIVAPALFLFAASVVSFLSRCVTLSSELGRIISAWFRWILQTFALVSRLCTVRQTLSCLTAASRIVK